MRNVFTDVEAKLLDLGKNAFLPSVTWAKR